jgi:hypothetical protein
VVSPVTSGSLRGDGDGEILIELATLDGEGWDEPLRVANLREEGTEVTSRGEVFFAYPFALTWPSKDPEQPFGGARFVINNVVAQDGTDEPVVLAALRGLLSQARVRFELIRLAAPDVVEQRTTRLRLTGISYNKTEITGALEMPNFTGRRAGYRFTPDVYRNLRAG